MKKSMPASSAILLLSPSEFADMPMITIRLLIVRRGTTAEERGIEGKKKGGDNCVNGRVCVDKSTDDGLG